MYIKLQEVVLIHKSKYHPQPNDTPAYKRELNNDIVFTATGETTRYDVITPRLIGIMYIDTNNNVCIVPDTWNENDAMCARTAVWPDMPPE